MQKTTEKNGMTKKKVSDGNEWLSTSKTFSKVSEKSAKSDETPRKVSTKQKEESGVAKNATFTKLKDNKKHVSRQKVENIEYRQKDKIATSSKKQQPSLPTGKAVTNQRHEAGVKTHSSTKKSGVDAKIVSNGAEKKLVQKKPEAEIIHKEHRPSSTQETNEIPKKETDEILKEELSDNKKCDTNLNSAKIVSEDNQMDLMHQQSQQTNERKEPLPDFEIGGDKEMEKLNPEEEIISASVEWKCLSDDLEHMSETLDESIDNQETKKPKTILKRPNSRKKQLKRSNNAEDRRETNSNNISEKSKMTTPEQLNNEKLFKMPLTVPKRKRINFLLSEKWKIKLPVSNKFKIINQFNL
ncbi:hypothetical protein LSTR_LSTR001290 [Laodelphax striatellus]|uniref:Uncharacterized protein n=1 Tax=Laodelphax striatellus TaxID=195883 RepID=A0A482XBS5_LAOST|nr:hypothetical protein LSTR_LSTR001290 [Laodelphax striatellus]